MDHWFTGHQCGTAQEKSLWGFMPEQGLLQWRRMTERSRREHQGGERKDSFRGFVQDKAALSHPAAFLFKSLASHCLSSISKVEVHKNNGLNQHFSNFNEHIHHLGMLLNEVSDSEVEEDSAFLF